MNLILPEPVEFKRPLPQRVIVARFRESHVPAGGWAKAAQIERRTLRRDLMRMKRHLMIDGQRELSAFLRKFIRERIEEVADRIEAMHKGLPRHAGKAETSFSLGANESTWRDVVAEILGPDANVELVQQYTPIVQSTASRSYDRTATFLGEQSDNAGRNAVFRRSQTMARQVTRINETTRDRLVSKLEQAMADGLTLPETAAMLRDSGISEIEAGRIPTIVRTEIGRACDEGTKEAMKESSTIKTVMVVGCTSVEPHIPTFDGRPTCNITGVPVERVDELEFHPNHTGTIVPETFTEP